jgi:hypothetical protein
MKKFVGVVAVAFVVFWVSTRPAGAAAFGKTLMAGLGTVAGGLIDFVTRVTS